MNAKEVAMERVKPISSYTLLKAQIVVRVK